MPGLATRYAILAKPITVLAVFLISGSLYVPARRAGALIVINAFIRRFLDFINRVEVLNFRHTKIPLVCMGWEGLVG